MISVSDLYDARKTTPQAAAALIPARTKLVMGLAVSQPPALLAALADRARAGSIDLVEI
jgi:itaconate CoA-transferase